jgi:hypothetical protein
MRGRTIFAYMEIDHRSNGFVDRKVWLSEDLCGWSYPTVGSEALRILVNSYKVEHSDTIDWGDYSRSTRKEHRRS